MEENTERKKLVAATVLRDKEVDKTIFKGKHKSQGKKIIYTELKIHSESEDNCRK